MTYFLTLFFIKIINSYLGTYISIYVNFNYSILFIKSHHFSNINVSTSDDSNWSNEVKKKEKKVKEQLEKQFIHENNLKDIDILLWFYQSLKQTLNVISILLEVIIKKY